MSQIFQKFSSLLYFHVKLAIAIALWFSKILLGCPNFICDLKCEVFEMKKKKNRFFFIWYSFTICRVVKTFIFADLDSQICMFSTRLVLAQAKLILLAIFWRSLFASLRKLRDLQTICWAVWQISSTSCVFVFLDNLRKEWKR